MLQNQTLRPTEGMGPHMTACHKPVLDHLWSYEPVEDVMEQSLVLLQLLVACRLYPLLALPEYGHVCWDGTKLMM